MIEARCYPEGPSGFYAEIILAGGEFRIVADKGDSLADSVGDLKRVGKLDRSHERLQLMESIGALPENAERKVDLGGRRDCDEFSHFIQNPFIV